MPRGMLWVRGCIAMATYGVPRDSLSSAVNRTLAAKPPSVKRTAGFWAL